MSAVGHISSDNNFVSMYNDTRNRELVRGEKFKINYVKNKNIFGGPDP